MAAPLPQVNLIIDDKGRPCQVDPFKGVDGLTDPGCIGAIGDGSSIPLRGSIFGLQGQTTRARSPVGGGGGVCSPSLVEQGITQQVDFPCRHGYSVNQFRHGIVYTDGGFGYDEGAKNNGGFGEVARRCLLQVEGSGIQEGSKSVVVAEGSRLQARGAASAEVREPCPDSGWLRGVCEHGATRWVRLRCKRRSCPVCGRDRRRMIAWRIARGLDILGGEDGGAWFVGTFARDIDKKTAIRVQAKFVRWLRQGQPGLQYAATWEVTSVGRLHLNLVLAPWRYVSQGKLSEAWQRFGGGKVVWVQRVGCGIGVEAAKSRDGIGGYLGKWEQMVMSGRGVAYSKTWPKLPQNPFLGRKGVIQWSWKGDLTPEARNFEYERLLGHWAEVLPGEFRFRYGDGCDCFEFENAGTLVRSPPSQRWGDLCGCKVVAIF